MPDVSALGGLDARLIWREKLAIYGQRLGLADAEAFLDQQSSRPDLWRLIKPV